MHQNINKPKNRATRTVYGPIFLPFYVIIVSFLKFFLSRCKESRMKLSCNRSQLAKETKLALYKTQSGESNYVDRKVLFYTLLLVQQLWKRHLNTTELASWLVHVLCDFKTMTSRSISLTMKVHFTNIFYHFCKSPPSIFPL